MLFSKGLAIADESEVFGQVPSNGKFNSTCPLFELI